MTTIKANLYKGMGKTERAIAESTKKAKEVLIISDKLSPKTNFRLFIGAIKIPWIVFQYFS